MAPALTEAATQARVKLSNGTTTPENTPLLNGRGHTKSPTEVSGRVTPKLSNQATHNKSHLVTLVSPQDLHHNIDDNTGNIVKSLSQTKIIKLTQIGNHKTISDLYDCGRRLNGGHLSSKVNGDTISNVMDKTTVKMTHSKLSTNFKPNDVGSDAKMPMENKHIPSTSDTGAGQNSNTISNTNFTNPSTSTASIVMQSINTNKKNENNSARKGVVTRSNSSNSLPLENTMDVTRKQQFLERRAERLMKRLLRLQAHQAASHTQHQLSGFVNSQHKNLQTMANSIKSPSSTHSSNDLKTELLQSEDVKNLSTASLVNLVRRLQASQITLRQRLTSSNTESRSVLTLDEDLCDEIDTTSGLLSTTLRHTESAVDSEATESSSGGESCDEMDWDWELEPRQPQPLIQRRAEWKWASDRAAVASKWTWLQAQVSDLEYRIRQQNDIYKQIRAAKGLVVLGDPPLPEDLMTRYRPSRSGGKKLSPIEAKIANLEKRNEMSPCNLSTLLSNIDRQSTKLAQSLGNCYSPIQATGKRTQTPTKQVVNGYIDPHGNQMAMTPESNSDNSDLLNKKTRNEQNVPPTTPQSQLSSPGTSMSGASPVMSPAVDQSCQSARCRPVRQYRKRKLLRTLGVHQLGRKAARLSSVKCQCYPPVTPCAMCGGRYNNKQHLDQYTMPLTERVALLDQAYHPVLSFSQDIPLTVHFEALLKNGDWHSGKASSKVRVEQTSKKKLKQLTKDHARKHSKKLAKSAAAVLLSTSFRRKYNDGKKGSHTGSLPSTPKNAIEDNARLCRTELKKRRAAQLAIDALRKQRSLSLPSRFKNSTPSPVPKDGTTLGHSYSGSSFKEMKEALKRRRVENAFDINNIVIPYSMAASTRVEKLQYKEIITPKWRDITLDKQEQQEEKTEEMPEATETKEEKLSPETTTDDPSEPKEVAKTEPPKVEVPVDTEKIEPENVKQEPVSSGETPTSGVTFTAGPTDEEEEEDISDEVFTARHLKCEIEEKKRFIANTVTNKRGVSNRSLRTESGATTPDLPISPDSSMNDSLFASLNSAPPTPSPLATTTPPVRSQSAMGLTSVTPGLTGFNRTNSTGSASALPPHRNSSSSSLSALNAIVEEGLQARRGSFSKRDRSMSLSEERERSGTGTPVQEVESLVPPWDTRVFPLNDEEFENLSKEYPPPSFTMKSPPTTPLVSKGCASVDETPSSSVPPSPVESNCSSILDDDPNDPEWTVITTAKPPQKQTGIVLKLAKR